MRLPIYVVQLVQERTITTPKVISYPHEAADIFRRVHPGIDREALVVIMLDVQGGCRGVNTVSIGSLNSSIANPREVFKPAVLSNAASIILIHNHPSGSTQPSPDDHAVCRRMVDAGKILDIEVMDFMIVTDIDFLSFKDRGYM